MKKFIRKIKSVISLHSNKHNQREVFDQQTLQEQKETRAAENALSEVYILDIEVKEENERLNESLKKLMAFIATHYPICDAKALYNAVAPAIDPDGTLLLKEGEKIFGKFNCDAHIEEEFHGKYAHISDRELFDYIVEDAFKLDGQDSDFAEKLNQAYANTLVCAGFLNQEYYKTFKAKLIPIFCSERVCDEQAAELYHQHYKRLDAGGFTLFQEAENLLGKLCYNSFPYEESQGVFECSDGFKLLRYLMAQEDVQLGDLRELNRWSVVNGTCVEKWDDLSVDESTDQYQTFRASLYRDTCKKLGLLWDKADLENQLEMRKQMESSSEDLGYKFPSALDLYSNEQIKSALQG